MYVTKSVIYNSLHFSNIFFNIGVNFDSNGNKIIFFLIVSYNCCFVLDPLNGCRLYTNS
jgi:hypothetical protein